MINNIFNLDEIFLLLPYFNYIYLLYEKIAKEICFFTNVERKNENFHNSVNNIFITIIVI